MKSIKMALMAGAAVAVSAAAAHADDLEALKAQIETLNARVAAMETAPSVPAGYSLLAVGEGELRQTPGLDMTSQELAAYGNESTVITVLPTADAPAGSTITWSGYARAGLVFSSFEQSIKVTLDNEDVSATFEANDAYEDNTDVDVKARGQIRVTAATDTAVGEVGVDLRVRGNFNGNGNADAYMDVAWGYWSMTPELTLGGGYAGSLGNVGYGYDGSCSCYYTDNADVGFNPGDTTQFRLSYGSGPVSFAVALEDASASKDSVNGDALGAAGELKYSGDSFSGEIAGVWRDITDDNINSDALWQIGAGFGFGLGDMAKVSIGAAMGEGPDTTVDEGEIVDGVNYNQTWWGVSALASVTLSDEMYAELAGGYKNRQGDEIDVNYGGRDWTSDGVDYDTWAVLAGIYYQPVDHLTIGLEGEYYTTSTSVSLDEVGDVGTAEVEYDTNNFSIDLVSVWRF